LESQERVGAKAAQHTGFFFQPFNVALRNFPSLFLLLASFDSIITVFKIQGLMFPISTYAITYKSHLPSIHWHPSIHTQTTRPILSRRIPFHRQPEISTITTTQTTTDSAYVWLSTASHGLPDVRDEDILVLGGGSDAGAQLRHGRVVGGPEGNVGVVRPHLHDLTAFGCWSGGERKGEWLGSIVDRGMD